MNQHNPIVEKKDKIEQLAIHGGQAVRNRPLPSCFPGGALIGEEEKAEVLDVLEARSPYRYYGPEALGKVKSFEREFAEKIGKKHALAVSSGTAALKVALIALGIEPGDEVIIPAVTFLASVGATVMAGGVPVFAEIDESLNLDPDDFEAKITDRTKAVMPVHIQGTPCAMDRIMEIASARGIKVLEDCAQSCGATFRGQMVGSFGHINAFSLQFNKVITSGEGGVVVTDDDKLYERAVRAHDHGVVRPESGKIMGLYQQQAFLAENYRMGELTGAMARAQLRKLDTIRFTLNRHAERIRSALAEIDEFELRAIPGCDDNVKANGDVGFCVVFFLPEINRARNFIEALNAENVGAYQLYGGDPVYVYPQVLNQRTAANPIGPFPHTYVRYQMGMCPHSESLLSRSVWIPVGTQYDKADTDDIIKAIRKISSNLK